MEQIERNRPARGMAGVAMTAMALFLTIVCFLALELATGDIEAAAQGTAVPPKDAPPLLAGQRVERPFGAIEISSLTREKKDQDTIFTVKFVIKNEKLPGKLHIFVADYLRLIADGVPRAPQSYSHAETDPTGSWPERSKLQTIVTYVDPDSGEYGWATFLLQGQPHEVYLQLGTGEEGRSYLRLME